MTCLVYRIFECVTLPASCSVPGWCSGPAVERRLGPALFASGSRQTCHALSGVTAPNIVGDASAPSPVNWLNVKASAGQLPAALAKCQAEVVAPQHALHEGDQWPNGLFWLWLSGGLCAELVRTLSDWGIGSSARGT